MFARLPDIFELTKCCVAVVLFYYISPLKQNAILEREEIGFCLCVVLFFFFKLNNKDCKCVSGGTTLQGLHMSTFFIIITLSRGVMDMPKENKLQR